MKILLNICFVLLGIYITLRILNCSGDITSCFSAGDHLIGRISLLTFISIYPAYIAWKKTPKSRSGNGFRWFCLPIGGILTMSYNEYGLTSSMFGNALMSGFLIVLVMYAIGYASYKNRYSKAQYNLGVMYDNGQGVPQDYNEAVKWYMLAAEQGYSKAQYNLGLMYALGHGVIKDYVIAHMFWDIAAVSGDKSAIENRGIVEKKMTSSQIEKAQDLAREWMQKHQ